MATKIKTETAEEKLAFEPPESNYIAKRQVFLVPINESRSRSPWGLRLYAAELVRERLGDDALVTSVKLKGPRLLSKARSRLSHQQPPARLCVTIKF